MATFIVTNVNDSGAGSLRQALADAQANGTGADTIRFDSSIQGQTIRLTSGELQIVSGSVTIDADANGDGNADVTISGDATGNGKSADDSRLFTVESGANLTLKTVDLQGGYSKGGQGYYEAPTGIASILNYGALTITDSRMRDMYARGADGIDGDLLAGYAGFAVGAIHNKGSALISNTVFEGNTAVGGDGGNGDDGLIDGTGGFSGGDAVANILNQGTLTITNSFMRDGTAIAGDGGDGGDSPFSAGSYIGDGGYGGDGGTAVNGIFNMGKPGYTSYVSGYVPPVFALLYGNTSLLGGTTTAGLAGQGGLGNPMGDDGIGGAAGWAYRNSVGILGFAETSNSIFVGAGSGSATGGADSISGAGGNDTIRGMMGNDSIFGFSGQDTLYGDGGNDFLDGGAYGDTLFGGLGDDFLFGGDGDDIIDGGFGNDLISGGNDAGNGDTISFAGVTSIGITVDLGNESAAQNTGLGNDTISGIENVVGGELQDVIKDNGRRNTLQGGNGDDVIQLQGTFADNALEHFDGGGGNDTLSIGTLLTNATVDLRNDSISSFEKLTFLRAAANGTTSLDMRADQFGTGLSLAATVTVDNFANTFEDIRIDANGATGLTLQNLAFAGNTSTLRLVTTFGNAANTFTGSAVRDVVDGQDGNDALNGNGGHDVLTGGLGKDTLNGGNEDDTLDGGSQNDILDGGSGNDTIEGGAGVDRANGGDGNDTLRGGSSRDILRGDADNDELFGETGNDLLYGGSGDDTLDGFNGEDAFDGGTGNDDLVSRRDGDADSFSFGRNYDLDTITFYEEGIDRLSLNDNLWGGGKTIAQVVADFATVNTAGTQITFDFGGGDILKVRSSTGGLDLVSIVSDIDIF